jgi:hypothetical protein
MSGPFHSYSQWAKKIAPQVQAALAGERDIPVQRPLTEAWLTYALFWNESPLSLEDVIQNADTVGHAIPNPEEIAWAFLRLRQRGWLSEQGKSFALTAEGRRSVEGVAGKGNFRERFERLIEWVLAHPP